jgi:preprotein translocase subunit SecA
MGRDPARLNHFCEGYKMFFSRALPELRRIAEYIRRGDLPPMPGDATRTHAPAAGADPVRQAPADARAGHRRRAPPTHKPGRNEPCPCGSGRKFKNCCGRP